MELFAPEVPPGLRYRAEFISDGEQAALVSALASMTFADFEMRGVVAKRRVAFFGESYGRAAAPPLPEFLEPLRAAVAAWAELAPSAFAMALVNEYRPGSPIGWHRDAPQYDVVAGVSLLSPCRMMFRPYVPPRLRPSGTQRRRTTHAVTLAARSVYLLSGAARTDFEHHIPPVEQLRYSVTFRTLRPRPVRREARDL